MTSTGHGGARPGAGRPRSTVMLRMPPEVIAQLTEIAEAEGVPVEDVVKDAMLTYMERWQIEHDTEEAEEYDYGHHEESYD